MKYLPFSQTKIMNSFFKPARISPKEISGANGKFLPKPLLFHLRHPNSKTNEPKFWQILSPKNSFAKTSSALFRHLPEYLEGRTPKKNVLSIFKKRFTPAKSKKQETFFFGVAGVLASAWGFLRIICFENRFELGTINTQRETSEGVSEKCRRAEGAM